MSLVGDSRVKSPTETGGKRLSILTPLFIPTFCLPQTRMQSLSPDPRAQYTSIYGALKKIIQTEGFWRPLRGLNVMMMGAGPAHAMYFACYENMKRTLNDVFSHQGNSHLANGIFESVCVQLGSSSLRCLLPGSSSSPGPSSLRLFGSLFRNREL